MGLQREKGHTRGLLRAEVAHRRELSPSFIRITLTGDDLARYQPLGADQWFRLFISTSPGSLDRLPASLGLLSYALFRRIPEDVRPVLRNYTTRAFRPAQGDRRAELDVDFVLHLPHGPEPAGPAVTWAQTCQPGDEVALIDEGITFLPAADVGRVLIAGDESALPAIAGILGSAAPDLVGTALIEVPTEADRLDLPAHPGIEVRWLVRGEVADHGAGVLDAVAAVELDRADQVWTAGEAGLVAGVRRAAVAQGVPKSRITFVGYWRKGRPAY